jgi:nitrous oxide reductase
MKTESKAVSGQQTEIKASRRQFLRAATIGGAGAVAAVVSSQTPIATEAQPAVPEDTGRGYRVSEHVLDYYRSTRL